MIAGVILAVHMMAPAHAQRQILTGEELAQWARSDQPGSGAFAGFVLGVHDAFNEIMFCTSRDDDRGAVVNAVSAFLDKRPDLLYKSAADVVRQALKEAFPCGR
jgi:hypothetical protein